MRVWVGFNWKYYINAVIQLKVYCWTYIEVGAMRVRCIDQIEQCIFIYKFISQCIKEDEWIDIVLSIKNRDTQNENIDIKLIKK